MKEDNKKKYLLISLGLVLVVAIGFIVGSTVKNKDTDTGLEPGEETGEVVDGDADLEETPGETEEPGEEVDKTSEEDTPVDLDNPTSSDDVESGDDGDKDFPVNQESELNALTFTNKKDVKVVINDDVMTYASPKNDEVYAWEFKYTDQGFYEIIQGENEKVTISGIDFFSPDPAKVLGDNPGFKVMDDGFHIFTGRDQREDFSRVE